MKYHVPAGIIACLVICLAACNQQPAASSATAEKIVINRQVFEKKVGTDCAKPDSLRINCGEIALHYPVVVQGNAALKDSVSAWANATLIGVLMAGIFEDTIPPSSLEMAATGFANSHQAAIKDTEDSPIGYWVAESTDTVLYNADKYLTLEINSYSFTGGAHGTPLSAVATFEVSTGRQLTWADLVTDTLAVKALLEKKYKESRKDIFQPTDGSAPFEFDDVFPFVLPANYGIVKEGLYAHYLHYEVGPYAHGDAALVVPFSELGALSKIK